MKYVVMAGVEITPSNPNGATCYDRNFITDCEEEARGEATYRNDVETAAGHDGVTWFVCPWPS